MKYRNKRTVEATQWFVMGDHPAVVMRDFIGTSRAVPWIETSIHGDFVKPGDWVVTREDGFACLVKDGIFQQTYEAVE